MKNIILLALLLCFNFVVHGQKVKNKKTTTETAVSPVILEPMTPLSEIDKTVNDFCECQSQLFVLMKEVDKYNPQTETENYNKASQKASEKSKECQNIAKNWSIGKSKEEMSEFREKAANNKNCDM